MDRTHLHGHLVSGYKRGRMRIGDVWTVLVPLHHEEAGAASLLGP